MESSARSDPEWCLQELLAGNRRYAEGTGIHPNQTVDRRRELLLRQSPLAVIISCSDSRVPPEIIFDCGLGDAFVTRVIGNVVDDSTLASVQFAVEKLRTKLILVLGHSDCRAVASAVDMEGNPASDPFETHLVKIRPAVLEAKARHKEQERLVERAIIENIRLNTARLKAAAWIKKEGTMTRGGLYSLGTGLVTVDPKS